MAGWPLLSHLSLPAFSLIQANSKIWVVHLLQTAQHKGRRKNFCSEWAEQYKWDDVYVTSSTNFYYPVDHSVGDKQWVLFEDLDDPAPRHSEHKWEILAYVYMRMLP